METSQFIITADVLVRVLVFLLYAPICLIVLRWLAPRLSPSTRLLAIAMLAAQILILAIGLQNIPRWDTLGWLVHLDQEWNIPSTFASIQLALVGAAALLTALLARSRQTLFRLNLVVIGLLFLLFAWDEYFYLHEDNMPLKIAYVTVGALIALASTKMALASPPRARAWQICLMIGMAIYVFGAVVLEPFHETCLSLGAIRIEGCVRFYNLEESLEFVGVWLVLVAVLGKLSDGTGKLGAPARLSLFVFPVIWTLALVHDSLLPRVELHLLAQPAHVQFEHDTGLLGYRLERDEDAIALWLYPSAWRSHYRELGFSLHLVDQASGESVASRNRHADLQFYWLQLPGYAHVYRQLITLEIPPDTRTNRAYWIALSFWRDDGNEYEILQIRSSDIMRLGDAQVVLEELVLPARAALPSAAPLAIFENGITLGAVDIPVRAIRGEALPILFHWTAADDIGEDYIQFLHLGHQATGDWWVYDQQPLGARLPTRLWYAGFSDGELWRATLPDHLAPGSYQVFTGLYHHRDRERLGAADAKGAAYVDNRVPLGALMIEERA